MKKILNRQQKEEMTRYVIVPAILGILGISSCGVGYIKENSLKENHPIYREYKENQSSLQKLRKELKSFTIFDFDKVAGIEKRIEIAREDSARIVNTPEIEEGFQEQKRINTYNKWGILGIGLSYIISFMGQQRMLFSRLKRHW